MMSVSHSVQTGASWGWTLGSIVEGAARTLLALGNVNVLAGRTEEEDAMDSEERRITCRGEEPGSMKRGILSVHSGSAAAGQECVWVMRVNPNRLASNKTTHLRVAVAQGQYSRLVATADRVGRFPTSSGATTLGCREQYSRRSSSTGTASVRSPAETPVTRAKTP